MSQRQPALVTSFWVRIAAEISLSPGWLLIAFPAVLCPTYLALEALFGRGLAAATDFGGDFEARIVLVHATTLGYCAMMGVYVARGALRDLDARHRGSPLDGSRCSPALAVPGELVVNCGYWRCGGPCGSRFHPEYERSLKLRREGCSAAAGAMR